MEPSKDKIKQLCLDSNGDNDGCEKLTDDERLHKIMEFMNCLTCGNLTEANKIIKDFQFSSHPELDEGILLSLTELMKKANSVLNSQQLKLKENLENITKTVDLAELSKKTSIDQVFSALKAELTSQDSTYTEFKQKMSNKNAEKQQESPPKESDKKLQSFLNIVWLGKYILEMILCKKSSEQFDMRLQIDDTLVPDPEVYFLVTEFTEWMRRVPSFMMFKKILDREVSIEFLESGKKNKEFYTSVDRFYGASAKRFEQNMIHILKRVLEMFDVWIDMEEKYFSKKKFVPLKGEQLKKFFSAVKRLNQLSNNQVKGRFYDNFSSKEIKMTREQNSKSNLQSSSESQVIASLRRENEALRDQNRRLARRQQQQTQTIQEKYRKIEMLQNQLKQVHTLVKRLQENQAELRRVELKSNSNFPPVDNLKKELEQLKQKIEYLQKEQLKRAEFIRESLSKFQEDITSLINDKKNGQAIVSARVVNPSIQEKFKPEELLQQVDQTHKRVKKVLQQFLSNTKSMEDETVRLNQKIKSLNEINFSNEVKIKFNQRTLESLKYDKKFLKDQLEQEKNKFSQQIDQKNKQIHRLTNNIKKIEKELSDKKTELLKLQKENEYILSIQKEQKETFQNEIKRKDHEIDSIKRELENRNFKFTQKCKDIEQMTMTLKKVDRCYIQYFNGRILNINESEHMQWFVKNLENGTKKQIRATYPLYRFNKVGKDFFHNQIDNKPDIVLIVKLKSGQILAGYSEPPFEPKTNLDYQKGLIFAFKNRKIFTMKEESTKKFIKTNPKPIIYDEFFIIWGNSDIRIRQQKLYSNYGTICCSYEEKGNENPSVKDLLMQEEREAQVEDYEFFQVEFEEEKL